MKRMARIAAAAALAVSFGIIGLGDSAVDAQEMEHGRRPPSALYLRTW
jgi:hypothetical protein